MCAYRKVQFVGIYGHIARGFDDMERAVSLGMGSMCLGLSVFGSGYRIGALFMNWPGGWCL